MIARLRTWWWRRVRGYDFEICDRCGRPASGALGGYERDPVVDRSPGDTYEYRLGPRTYWFAPNDLARGRGGRVDGRTRR